MGEITDALRRARLERAQQSEKPDQERPEESLSFLSEPLPTPDLSDAPVETLADDAKPVEIARNKQGFWQARSVIVDRHAAVSERFRHLAIRVRRELEQRNTNSLLVTSSLRQEGKTVTSCNLALALASMAAGRRVALIDLDLRRPSVSRAMGVEAHVGFERALAGEVPIAATCLRTDIPGLDLYLVAAPVPEAHQLLARAALSQAVTELSRRYETVVCDTPPVLLVPDVPLIAPHFGACLAVARAGRTRRSMFRDMLALLPPQKLIGTFLNQVRSTLRSSEYEYGYYLEEGSEESKPRSKKRRRKRKEQS